MSGLSQKPASLVGLVNDSSRFEATINLNGIRIAASAASMVLCLAVYTNRMHILRVNLNSTWSCLQVKSSRNKKKKPDDDDETMSMTTTTETTETTLVDVMANNAANATGEGVSLWEFEEMKKEVDRLKEKCDKLEKEKAEDRKSVV